MLKKLNYTQKNKLLLPVLGLGLVLCWFFALNKTVEAIQLNRELKSQSVASNDISFNPVHTQRKLDALQGILKSYRVKPADWSNDLWMKASALAMKQHVGIDYVMTKPALEKDTTTIGAMETINCYGNYTQLIKLVDTLERIPKIGRISALQIRAPKEEVIGERVHQCVLSLEFRGITDL